MPMIRPIRNSPESPLLFSLHPLLSLLLPVSAMSRLDLRGVWLALLLASLAVAHGGHEAPEGVVISDDPIVCRVLRACLSVVSG